MMLRLICTLLSLATICYGDCTLTGVSITLGNPNVITFTGSSGVDCPGSGSSANAVTSANPIPAGAIVTGQDGTRGAQASAASIDALGNVSFPGSVLAGVASGKTGTIESTNSVSGHTFGFAAPDTLGSDYLYLPPPSPVTNGFLQDLGVVACPSNMPAGAPTVCRQLATATPAGGSGGGAGALVLLEQHAAASSASLDFTGCISSLYDEYEIHLVSLVPSITSQVSAQLRMSTNGGTTFDSANTYAWTRYAVGNTGASGGTGGNPATGITLNDENVVSLAGWSLNGLYRLYNPGGAGFKLLHGQSVTEGTVGSSTETQITGGIYQSITPVNAFQVRMNSGTITSGTVRCYGIAR